MAIIDHPYTGTDLAARIPEIWTPMILEQMFARTVGFNFFTDLTSYMSNGGDIAHIADIYTNTLSASTQSTQGAEVTTQDPAQVDVTLTVDTHKYIAMLLGDKDKQQLLRSFDFNSVYAKKAGDTLADALEASIFALWSGLSTNTITDTANVFSDSEARQALAKLEALNFRVNPNDVAWFVHPVAYWTQIAAIQKYYDAQQRGEKSIVTTGNLGPLGNEAEAYRGILYNLPVYATTNVVSSLGGYRNLLAHKSAFGFALQTPGGGKVRTQAENQLRNLGLLTVVDILYGVAELRDNAAVVLSTSNTALAA